MFSKVMSAGLMGIDAYLVSVEVDIRRAHLPSWSTVGLADSAVRESKERVKAGIRNSGYDFMFRSITINLAPANTKKDGTAFDLPIALALMQASGYLPCNFIDECVFVGEMSLTGELRPVSGALSIAMLAEEQGYRRLIIPKKNAEEAAVVKGIDVYPCDTLAEVVELLKGQRAVAPQEHRAFEGKVKQKVEVDFHDVRGQYQAKRALEIAAAGGHNVLLSGPPGSGKTMLASRVPSILPPLSFNESLETSKVYSVSGLLDKEHGLLKSRPFRQPHHSISTAGLIGGGSYPKPGEVSFAHNGVLFLDEFSEFPRNVLELLRQPLEDQKVTIARAATTLTYPARFMLIASCNPCPCGYLGHEKINCQCSPLQVARYRSKLSGPLLDRIDIQLDVPAVSYEELRGAGERGESSQRISERVARVRQIQARRYKDQNIYLNSQMSPKHIETYCELDQASEKILKTAVDRFHLSARAISRALKLSRTLADMNDSEKIKCNHVLEAIQYRGVDGGDGDGGGI